jgi:hypothetical protein
MESNQLTKVDLIIGMNVHLLQRDRAVEIRETLTRLQSINMNNVVLMSLLYFLLLITAATMELWTDYHRIYNDSPSNSISAIY